MPLKKTSRRTAKAAPSTALSPAPRDPALDKVPLPIKLEIVDGRCAKCRNVLGPMPRRVQLDSCCGRAILADAEARGGRRILDALGISEREFELSRVKLECSGAAERRAIVLRWLDGAG